LISSTQSLQDKQTEQETLEDRLDDLTQEIAEKSKNEVEERKQLSLMISALVEIAGRPPESLFMQDHVTEDHIHRSLLLKAILPRLREQAEGAARDLAALYDLQEQLAKQKKLVEASQANLQNQQRDLDQLIATRQGFLQRTEEQKAEVARHLAALSDEARDLRQFGERDADGVTSEGLTLAGPSGAPVVAPHAGRVVFAGPFRGYGQILILQHDNGYHSFLSGFGRIDAEMGQEVEAGEPLGVLPVKNGGKPELYFEWRRGDEPVDPMGGLPH
jgi:septal ring factor EnvC (AmiA/AmiB activator)